jgi:hypothetical protein
MEECAEENEGRFGLDYVNRVGGNCFSEFLEN